MSNSEQMYDISFHLSPPPRSPLVAQKIVQAAMPRPPLDPLTNLGPPRDLTISVPRDRSPTAPPATCSDILTPSPTSSPSEPVHPHLSPSRRRPPSRRQSSISYLPPDSPRLWSPRTPLTGLNSPERSSPLSGANGAEKDGHARTRSIPQRAISEPAVLTLAERYADLLQFIAQKESKCLELRTQLAIHESELLELKRKWERIVRREFGRNIPSTSTPVPPATSAVFNGLVGGVRALAAATTSPPLTPSMSRAPPSSAAFANHEPRQATNSISSTTTTSSSLPSASGSPRHSQSSISSVAEVKADSGKEEGQLEEVITRDSVGAKLAPAMKQQQPQRLSPLSEKLQSPSSKVRRRRERDSQAPLADALKALTGEDSHSGSGTRVSESAVSPTPISINPLSAMGLGRANFGEAAQGWVDSVGSKLAELQRGETFSKSQKRASLILSDVSQSIFSALAPASTANTVPAFAPASRSLLDEEDDGSTALGRAMVPDVVAVSGQSASPQTSTGEKDEESWNW